MNLSASAPVSPGATLVATQARLVAGTLALVFGLVLFLGTGFAAPSLIHNATHDTRHALGLPCH